MAGAVVPLLEIRGRLAPLILIPRTLLGRLAIITPGVVGRIIQRRPHKPVVVVE